MTANIATRLIEHYVDNFRRLPWRSPPGSPSADPYRVWLSEIMLQQTTVAAVVPRFERFLARWPTVAALAAASDSDILSEWAGLGYYARARNLIACARKVTAMGAFPRSSKELRELPGIGDYTSAAIAAIAFGEKVAAIDTNVQRVIARLEALARPQRREIADRMIAVMPGDRPGDFVQALMDLGATICRPRRPQCDLCPLRDCCKAHALGASERFPEPRRQRERPHRFGTAFWIERDRQLWLVRRPPRGILGGMAALPGGEWTDSTKLVGDPIGVVRHRFTHFTLDLSLEIAPEPIGEGWWHPLHRLGEAGLPTLYRRAAELAIGRQETGRAAA